MRRRARTVTKRVLHRLGIEVRRVRPVSREPWHEWRLGETGVQAGTVIDVGAADGTPALDVAFPDAYLVLVEPNPAFDKDHEARLDRREGEIHRVALGASPGTARLEVEPDWPLRASLLQRSPMSRRDIPTTSLEVPVVPLDSLAQDHDWPTPYVIKADTEGFELEVLRGAERTLEQTDLVVLELSVARLYEDSYTFAGAIRWLDDRGFALLDLPDVVRFEGVTMHVDAVFRRIA